MFCDLQIRDLVVSKWHYSVYCVAQKQVIYWRFWNTPVMVFKCVIITVEVKQIFSESLETVSLIQKTRKLMEN
jgi:hypothetical protein